jgi:hypothetical protein
LDTVFGLSLTSTGVGWVLVEGHAADGATLAHDELAVRSGGGFHAVETSKQVAAAVLRAEATATATGGRLRVIGVTWSDDAAAGAALLVEQLTAAGFDNVVPVRWAQAAETLADGLVPVVGYDKTAVCVLEHESATVVMVDACDGETRTAVEQVTGDADGLVPVVGYDKTAVCVLEHESATVVMVDACDGETRTAVEQVTGDADGLFRWVSKMFAPDGWRPDGVVVVGSDAELEDFSSELKDALHVPVFAQSGAELALARGAALASAQEAGFTETPLLEPAVWGRKAGGRTGLRTPSYAGALTALVAASVTLVGSLSLAVGLRLTPDKPAAENEARATTHLVRALPAPRVANVPIVPPAPAAPPPTAKPQPAAAPELPAAQAPAPLPEQPATQSSESSGGVPDQPAAVPPAAPPAVPPPPAPEVPPPDPHPLLTRVLEHIRGHQPDPPAAEPPADPPPSP